MSSSAFLHLAQAGIGAVWVGIPAASVVQAIVLPAQPARLPRRHGALLGVVEHEGRPVPVVDLARWVDVGAAPAAQQAGQGSAPRVLILHADGRTIGLKVDTVGGLVEVAQEAVSRLHHDDREEEVFHCVARDPASGRILSLLDAGRLARLAAAWHEEEGSAAVPAAQQEVAQQDEAQETQEALPRSYAVLQAGAARLAVAADALTEVLPMPALQTLGAGSGMAWCPWRARHLPVLAHAALGLEPAADGAAPALLAVIEHAGLALGLPVHAALSLQEFDCAHMRAADGVLSVLFEPDGAALRVLDEARLFARFPEVALSREDGERADAGRAQASGTPNAGAYIVFEGDGMAAARIDMVERIVSLRDAATDGRGAMSWNGRTIPLRDLRASGRREDGSGSGGDVMVVRGEETHVGYVVARVHLLVPPGTARIYSMGGGGWAFLATGEGAAQASYRIVELDAPTA